MYISVQELKETFWLIPLIKDEQKQQDYSVFKDPMNL